jgi:cytochrome P450
MLGLMLFNTGSNSMNNTLTNLPLARAGSDTVAAGIQSFVYHIIRHSSAWVQAYAENETAMKESLRQDSIVSWASSRQLPYVQIP